jgi:hypothetical protein
VPIRFLLMSACILFRMPFCGRSFVVATQQGGCLFRSTSVKLTIHHKTKCSYYYRFFSTLTFFIPISLRPWSNLIMKWIVLTEGDVTVYIWYIYAGVICFVSFPLLLHLPLVKSTTFRFVLHQWIFDETSTIIQIGFQESPIIVICIQRMKGIWPNK